MSWPPRSSHGGCSRYRPYSPYPSPKPFPVSSGSVIRTPACAIHLFLQHALPTSPGRSRSSHWGCSRVVPCSPYPPPKPFSISSGSVIVWTSGPPSHLLLQYVLPTPFHEGLSSVVLRSLLSALPDGTLVLSAMLRHMALSGSGSCERFRELAHRQRGEPS